MSRHLVRAARTVSAFVLGTVIAGQAAAQAAHPAPASHPGAATHTAIRGEHMMTYHKPTDDELHKRLTPLQYQVTQDAATERPFHNAYWDNHATGIYVDIVSGEPLFSSLDKFNSGTGWPSFTKPLEAANIQTKVDHSDFMTRTEVRSTHANSHLGHLFDDGPPPTGLRYCMNSASLRFVPVDSLAAEGYGQFLPLFTKAAPAEQKSSKP